MAREDNLRKKYMDRLRKGLEEKSQGALEAERAARIESKHYLDFKKELLPKRLSFYERGCQWAEKIIKIKPGQKRYPIIQDAIDTCHLDITPEGVVSFSLLFPILFAVVFALLGYVLPYLLTGESTFFFTIFFAIVALLLIPILGRLPEQFAKKWRLAASNQMVQCIFFIVTFMRHTSNLENAINFASEHLVGPLALDLKKVLWDVETEKYESIRESIDIYLQGWRETNQEFVEAFHLIESSLLESNEARRVQMLDKSLDVILEGTYEKMLHFAQNLKSPLTALHLMGIILPILGLVILPLIVSIMEVVRWYHIAVIYNILLPIAVYYMGKNILATRPTGYGDTDISEFIPELKRLKKIRIPLSKKGIFVNPLGVCIFIGVIFFIAGLVPIFMHAAIETPAGALVPPDICISAKGKTFNPAIQTELRPMACFLGYKYSTTRKKEVGPYGLGASIFSIMIVLGLSLGIGLYYRFRSKELIKVREDTKKLEQEFASGLFQLGNRMADGIPAEIAFGKVAATLEGTESGAFFSAVSQNIARLGVSIQTAIFDPKVGVIRMFPSATIQSSMKVFIESAKKGPMVAARSLLNISRYIKEIHRVNERLRDLLADIITDMKSQVKFLAPAIAGVVVGITSMITFILGRLNLAEATGGLGDTQGLAAIFAGDGVPTYFFQIIVGIYVIQIIYILTVLGNNIENGVDKLNEEYALGTNITKSMLLYCFITLIVTIIFSLLAGLILERGLA
ncbi:hypothetical protein KY335_05835 [Candidatus Woesearchaeota archaeon]|nr:hypothetical protein [Candidatus Woesearchaeota archaeon]MBW3014727.1 hypothetical protein [Candidatus Woesearchaeota archaeon]